MNKQTKILSLIVIGLFLTLNLISAMTISSVDAENFSPGEEQEISLKVKNTIDKNVEEVSVDLDISETPFVIMSAEEVDEVDEDDTETLDVMLKVSNNARAGDYSISYTLTYTIEGESDSIEKEGTFTLTIEANPELSYSVNVENPIIGNKGKIKFTIVNKGLGDAKFVNIKINPQGYTLLSANNDYVGTIGSDDFETMNLDVIFKEANPVLNAEIEYRDFDNQKITQSVTLPVKIYSNEEALSLGIIQKNNTVLYIFIGIACLGSWFIIRKIRKKKRQNKAQGK